MKTPSESSPKALSIIAAGMALASVAAFIAGIVLIVIGLNVAAGGTPSGVLAGDAPEKAGFDDGRPVGLYFMTRFWSSTGSLEKAVWYFTEDGAVYRDLERGFSDEALAAHEGARGTARRDGDALIVKWSDGEETRSEIERDGSAFTWDMGIFTPVTPFEDESEVVGRWEGGESITVSGGSAANARMLELREDGTFSQSSTGSVSARSSDSTVSGGSSSASAGKWELDDHSLTLTYADGTVVRGVSFPYDDGESKRLFFNGTMYKRLQ